MPTLVVNQRQQFKWTSVFWRFSTVVCAVWVMLYLSLEGHNIFGYKKPRRCQLSGVLIWNQLEIYKKQGFVKKHAFWFGLSYSESKVWICSAFNYRQLILCQCTCMVFTILHTIFQSFLQLSTNPKKRLKSKVRIDLSNNYSILHYDEHALCLIWISPTYTILLL